MDLSQLRDALQKECLLQAGGLLVVGVSGGADSLCLLDGLRRLGTAVLVAHFDHGLRPDSAQDALRVAELAQRWGLPWVTGRGDVRAQAAAQGLSIEEAARKARYGFLFAAARQHQAEAVAVAHTADDQVETVLMHLLRGAALSGLKGMLPRLVVPEWDAQIPLVRPLLGVWRAETQHWCAEYELAVIEDPSNQETVYFRNRLRHRLIPELQRYNPQIKAGLWRMARVLAGEWQVVEESTLAAWQRCLLESGAGWVALSWAEMQALSLGLQRAVLRRGLAHMRPALRDIDSESIERALQWLGGAPRARWYELPDGLHLGVEQGRVVLAETRTLPASPDWPQMPVQAVLSLAAPGEVPLAGGWRLQAGPPAECSGGEERCFQAAQESGPLELTVQVDGERLALPLQVRPANPGERLAPLGMAGHRVKISEDYINRKLPQRARPRWPVVFSGDEALWLCGLRLSESFKVTEATRQVVTLRLIPPAG